jgi:hypothetical protein
VQLLLAFLLSLAFTPRFNMLTTFDLGLYVTTLILGACSAALLMAPACYTGWCSGNASNATSCTRRACRSGPPSGTAAEK